ncbi:MAG: hypothetical protein RLN76_02155 [Phycisphaeraceae bacterium]
MTSNPDTQRDIEIILQLQARFRSALIMINRDPGCIGRDPESRVHLMDTEGIFKDRLQDAIDWRPINDLGRALGLTYNISQIYDIISGLEGEAECIPIYYFGRVFYYPGGTEAITIEPVNERYLPSRAEELKELIGEWIKTLENDLRQLVDERPDTESHALKEHGWLSSTQAAELLKKDIPSLTLGAAKTRISRAVSLGQLKTNGQRGQRLRIEPDSLGRWRLEQRDKDLDSQM